MKRTKSLVIGAVMVSAMSLLAGCGSDKVGYVDTNKIVQQSQKMADVNKDVAAKKAELEAKINLMQQLFKRHNKMHKLSLKLIPIPRIRKSKITSKMKSVR